MDCSLFTEDKDMDELDPVELAEHSGCMYVWSNQFSIGPSLKIKDAHLAFLIIMQ